MYNLLYEIGKFTYVDNDTWAISHWNGFYIPNAKISEYLCSLPILIHISLFISETFGLLLFKPLVSANPPVYDSVVKAMLCVIIKYILLNDIGY